MTTLELLTKARKRIANKKRWTQRAYALAKWNKPVPRATDSRAVRWCALGALEYENIAWNSSGLDSNCLDKRMHDRAADILGNTLVARKQSPNQTASARVVDVNDKVGHAETLAMFDEAIHNLS